MSCKVQILTHDFEFIMTDGCGFPISARWGVIGPVTPSAQQPHSELPGDGMAFSGDGFDSRIFRMEVVFGCNRIMI